VNIFTFNFESVPLKKLLNLIFKTHILEIIHVIFTQVSLHIHKDWNMLMFLVRKKNKSVLYYSNRSYRLKQLTFFRSIKSSKFRKWIPVRKIILKRKYYQTLPLRPTCSLFVFRNKRKVLILIHCSGQFCWYWSHRKCKRCQPHYMNPYFSRSSSEIIWIWTRAFRTWKCKGHFVYSFICICGSWRNTSFWLILGYKNC
jgi:hypothetical protein